MSVHFLSSIPSFERESTLPFILHVIFSLQIIFILKLFCPYSKYAIPISIMLFPQINVLSPIELLDKISFA